MARNSSELIQLASTPAWEDEAPRIPKEIDPVMKARVDRLWFGTGNPHTSRMALLLRKLRNYADHQRHLEDLNEARLNILQDHGPYLAQDSMRAYLDSFGRGHTQDEFTARRDSGDLLGIHDHGVWLYPLFQVHPEIGEISPLIRQVNDIMEETDDSPLEIMSWWVLPRESLEDATLADVLYTKDGPKHVKTAIAQLTA